MCPITKLLFLIATATTTTTTTTTALIAILSCGYSFSCEQTNTSLTTRV